MLREIYSCTNVFLSIKQIDLQLFIIYSAWWIKNINNPVDIDINWINIIDKIRGICISWLAANLMYINR